MEAEGADMTSGTGSPTSTSQSPLIFPSDTPTQPYRPLDHIQKLRRGGNDPDLSMSSTMSRPRRNMHQSFMTLCAEVGTSAAQEQEEDNLTNDVFEGQEVKPSAQTKHARLQQETKQHLNPSVRNLAAKDPRRPLSTRQEMMRSLPALSRQTLSKQKRKQLSMDDTMMLSSQILQRPATVHEETPAVPDDLVNIVSSSVTPSQPEYIDDLVEESTLPEQSLPDVLAGVFSLETREEVDRVYPCWTIRSSQSAMIPGHMYILETVVCFYAYLPKRAHATLKSGYIAKRGRQNPRYNRYWFVLKGSSLSYYIDRSQPYFPRNTIDLSSATSVQLLPSAPQTQTYDFSITTGQQTFQFKLEKAEEAKQWVQQIDNAIVRSRNDSDSIKYLIPIKNIIGVEEEQILEGTTTVQINVKNSGEALDEYIFSFFTDAIDAKDHIMSLQAQATKAISVEDAISPLLQPLADIQVKPNSRMVDDTPSLSGDILEKVPTPPDRKYSTESLRPELRPSSSTSSMYQKATGLAGLVKTPFQRVTNLLATESYNYYGKAYGMWAGNKIHYDEEHPDSPALHESQQDEKTVTEHNERFRNHFALPKSERLLATFYCYLSRTVPRYGKIYMGITRLCFRSLIPPFRIKMILPYKAIESLIQKQSHLSSTYGLVLSIRGQEELFFEFREQDSRDDCALLLHKRIEAVRHLEQSTLISPAERAKMDAAKAEHELLNKVRRGSRNIGEVDLPDMEELADALDDAPVIYDDYDGSNNNAPVESPGPLRITCLTIGSRGDVQPFIALCKGLKTEGHTVTIATHSEFEDWILSHGINFAPIAGDPAQLMRLCVEHDMFTPGFVREAWFGFRNMVSDILNSAWESCRDCDLLIEAPNAMAGVHIAEALHIPLFRAFTMPWTKTRAHPHAFLVPRTKRGGLYNLGSHVLFQQAYWQGISGLVNTWRKDKLGLPPTGLAQMQQERIPFMYNFSPNVVSTPLDWDPWIKITGYWFLDEGSSATFTPPPALVEFIAKARNDGKKLVYIGFGSIVIDDAATFASKIVDAVLQADVRCILSKGWSGRLDTAPNSTNKSTSDVALPDSIYAIDKAPHDWLFAQMDAAVHHGGAGTTGASIRAGIPTIIKPFFGDQWFFGQRVEDLGIGLCLHKVEAPELANALRNITTSARMKERARELGEKVRAEDGVKVAIQTVYRHLEYARTLVKERDANTKGKGAITEPSEGLEEGWTLVDDEEEGELLDMLQRKGSSDVEEGPGFGATLGKMGGSEVVAGSLSVPGGEEDDVELMDRLS